MSDRPQIPARGEPAETVLDALASFRADDVDWKGGRTWSLVYDPGPAHRELLLRAHALYASENGLNPMAFPGLHRLERETVQMTASLLNAPESCAGTLTSGGTESLLLAVLGARNRARRRRPNVVLPETAHVAFDKAAHAFGVRLKRAPVDENGAADVGAMRRLVDRNTVLLVASAPQYPHGTVDPVPEIGRLAERKRIPLHVDACFGGFLLPWLERIGVELPAWDFRVPGVTSISADLHKYGFAAKGASVLLHRDREGLRHQLFVATDWSGGIYASPSLPGTRPGGPIAAAWAALRAMGEDGYLERAKEAWETAERMRRGIEAITELRILGRPHSTIVTWASRTREVDVYAVADVLQARGWSVDRQQRPPCVHCTVNASNAPVLDRYLEDLREAVAEVKGRPERGREGEAAMYGLMARVPVRRVVRRAVEDVMLGLYGPGDGRPALTDATDDPVARHGRRVLDALERVGLVRA